MAGKIVATIRRVALTQLPTDPRAIPCGHNPLKPLVVVERPAVGTTGADGELEIHQGSADDDLRAAFASPFRNVELGDDVRQSAPQKNLTRLFQLFQPSPQTRFEATYDSNRAVRQASDVVPDGAGAMAVNVAGQQSL